MVVRKESPLGFKVMVHGNVTRIHTVCLPLPVHLQRYTVAEHRSQLPDYLHCLALSSSNLFSFSCLLVYNRGIQ